MHVSYLLFFLSLSVFAEVPRQIQVIPNPQSVEDFDHQFKGCLENSECDQVMGLQLSRWKELIDKLKEDKVEAAKKPQFVELFRGKYGIPVEFYTYQKSQQGFKPLLFNSPCKDHNPKDPNQKVLRGIAFVKSLTKEKAVVWRDQTQIEVPTDELLMPQPVTVYYPEGAKTYYLPLGEQPLFLKNKEMYVLREEDGFFYPLKVSENGDWKIEGLDMARLTEWEDKKENATCPKDEKKLAPKVFGVEFCKSVWDEDSKKTVVVKMHQGCVI